MVLLLALISYVAFTYADTLSGSEDLSNIPAPLRYYTEGVSVDAKVSENVAIPFTARFEYVELMEEETYLTHLAGSLKSCYHTIPRSQTINTEVPGYFTHLVFKNAEITKYKVKEPYDENKRSTQVEFHTSWNNFETYIPPSTNTTTNTTATTTSEITYEEIVSAFKLNEISNISFSTTVDPNTASTCPGSTEYYPVPMAWCEHESIMYDDLIVDPVLTEQTGSNGTKSCVIKFSDQIEHYKKMWKKGESFATVRQKCLLALDTDFSYSEFQSSIYSGLYSSFYYCHRTYGGNKLIPKCYDPRYPLIDFVQNGRGMVVDYSIGKGNVSIDINMTIEFTDWTADFVRIFSDTFRDCDYKKAFTQMDIELFIPEIVVPPERGPPWYIWILAGFLGGPILVFLLAVFFLLFLRSRRGFRVDVWQYWRKQRAIKEQRRLSSVEQAQDSLANSQNKTNPDLGLDNPGIETPD